MSFPRILVTGGQGLLGRQIEAVHSARGGAVLAPGHAELDILKARDILHAVDDFKPDCLINCAAVRDVDMAEKDPDHAMQVNAYGATACATICREHDIRLIHISTDYVFSGNKKMPYTEKDPVRPVNAYGRSKAEAERGIQAIGGNALIVRTSKLFGRTAANLVDDMCEQAGRGRTIHARNDQHFSPTSAEDLAQTLLQLAVVDITGILHVVNRGISSKFTLAREIVHILQADCRVLPAAPTHARRDRAPRPRYVVLNTEKLTQQYGIRLPTWRERLRRYLQHAYPRPIDPSSMEP